MEEPHLISHATIPQRLGRLNEEMEKMRITDRAGEVDALEFSSVPEVQKWIKMSE